MNNVSLGPEGGGDSAGVGGGLVDSYHDVEKQHSLDDRNYSSSQHLAAQDTHDSLIAQDTHDSLIAQDTHDSIASQDTHDSLLTVVVSGDESSRQDYSGENPAPDSKFPTVEQMAPTVSQSPKKPTDLSRNSSSHEQCRICLQEKDEALIDLGCHCRGGLAKAHQSCISTWFGSRGSNKCEICQQVTENVALPESQASYWVWRLDPAYRGRDISQERERGCFSPLWVAFSILIGGLLLDVLISITLGVSALPVNIIIGVIVVLGLGTVLRLALEFCREWSLRRVVHRVEANASLGYHPAF